MRRFDSSKRIKIPKVIFLDYDGVLNNPYYMTTKSWEFRKQPKCGYESDFDIKRVKILKEICEETKAKVVVTSSWRGDIEAIAWLKDKGIPIIDTTPEVLRRGHRGDEIRAFLDQHEVDQYLIFDDETSDFNSELMEHVICTRENYLDDLKEDWCSGLQKKHILWAKSMLNS